jgi:hypothetical protein
MYPIYEIHAYYNYNPLKEGKSIFNQIHLTYTKGQAMTKSLTSSVSKSVQILVPVKTNA